MLNIRSSTADLITSVILLIAVALLINHTFSMPPSPVRGYPGAAFFPRLALIGTGIFTVLWIGLIIRARLGGKDLLGNDTHFVFEYRDYIISIVSVVVYMFALDIIGFEISTFVFLLALLITRVSPIWAFVSAFIATLVLYGTFVLLLNVSLPMLFLPRYVSF
ncbi:tripartite tricarboxylate transporter TctB family protein [Aureimonas fodinaquatilis]|uniref:Tripartite tricarboxylate transporter TctB family protein n=1 Tax=Aureimonas fodinaquatilis TaxID=2565783 RepID=A0A5B0DT50_9HYPH|nr:tripartite tricarboxylate transporter TctB family protein [Aureimonas fodinaquatilis]KAA0969583.1 tripartite tricarboxylate transporter TctB family protein [Aureimonas fodinaquatilis]